VSRETGEVRSHALPNVNADNLRNVLTSQVDPAQTPLHTDSWYGYRRIASEFANHSSVDHSVGEYVRGDVSTKQAESYFAQLKRSLDGTHHRVSVEHLPRYLSEFDFRRTHRTDSDTERMGRLVGRVGGRRLTYRQPGRA